MSGYFMEYAPALLAAGFEPVPIAPGYKYPKGIANWQEMEITADVVDRWAANGKSGYGVGIRCRTCPAVDIDCQDELIVEQSIRLVNSIIGLDNPLCRVGNPPKALLPFKTSKPFTKLKTNKYQAPDGKTHQIEILGAGQQYVAYANHPDTGNPYTWDMFDLFDFKREDLPELTLEKAREIIRRFETEIVQPDWIQIGGGIDGDQEDAPGIAPSVPIGITPDQIEKVLSVQCSNDYDSWVKVGMAVHHETGGSAEGLELWDKWSFQSDKYSMEACRDKWSTFESTSRSITMRSMIKEYTDRTGDRIDLPFNADEVFEAFEETDHPSTKKARFIDATELINREIVINYLVQDFIETPTTGLIFGDPGTKKSFIAIDLACSIATGTPWMGQMVTQGPVFYFAGEGKAGIPRRIKAWLKYHNQVLQPGMLHVSDLRIEITPQSARGLITEIKHLTEQYGLPALIIIDTLARHLPSESDENSAKDFGQFVNAIDHMRDAFNCVALIIHHSGKQNKDSSRGTSAIKGALDFEFKTDGLKLECKKQKEGEEPMPLMYHLENVEIADGISSAVVVSDGFGNRTDPTKKLKARSVMALEVLKMEISTSGRDAVSREQWRDSFYVQLGTDISKSGKANAMKNAEQELLDAGLIVNELGRYRLVEDDSPF